MVMAPPGLLLGDRYRLDDRIAVGGMGEVWQATDLVLERPVAVKMLQSGSAQHEEALARFRAEARFAGSLSHPNIARVYDYCDADSPNPPCLVMELVNGSSLARLLKEGPVDPARTMDLIAQTAGALQATHAAGVVHRDIKPGNLLVTKGGQVKITDFGIARAAGSAPVTRTGVLMGTPAYLAPERAAGASATPAADLYALGIVAYQCLTGKLPFDGQPLAVALAQVEQPLPPLPQWLPAEVAHLVAELTAKDPKARPSSAGQVAERAEHLRAVLAARSASPHSLPVLSRAAARAGVTAAESALPRMPADDGIRQRRKQNQRTLAPLPGRAALLLAVLAVIAAAGWVMSGVGVPTPVHGPSGPPAATRHPGPWDSHRVVPVDGTGRTRATYAPGLVGTSKASGKPRAPSATPTADGTPTPARTPTPTGTLTPSDTSTPSQTPTPAGTPTADPSVTLSLVSGLVLATPLGVLRRYDAPRITVVSIR
jgi:serine/threonine-protein kinase